MKLVRTKDLQVGMLVADDVFESKNSLIPLLSKGVALTMDFIKSLSKHGIPWVYVEVPDDYRGMIGEVLELNSAERDIIFDGKVQINGDVKENIKIEAEESIVIKGSVSENCIITSKTGAILISGQISGTAEARAKISSSQKIHIKSARFAELKTNGEVKVAGDICDSSVTSRGAIEIEGKAYRVELYSLSKILLGECGNPSGEATNLIVRPSECRELFNELLKIDSGVTELIKEKERLQNVIDLVKKLGKEVDQLPQEKKLGLAAGVKRFKDIEAEMASFQKRKSEIKAELESYLNIKRILVNGTVFPGTRITIENSKLLVNQQDQRLAFYARDFKIASSPYSGSF